MYGYKAMLAANVWRNHWSRSLRLTLTELTLTVHLNGKYFFSPCKHTSGCTSSHFLCSRRTNPILCITTSKSHTRHFCYNHCSAVGAKHIQTLQCILMATIIYNNIYNTEVQKCLGYCVKLPPKLLKQFGSCIQHLFIHSTCWWPTFTSRTNTRFTSRSY